MDQLAGVFNSIPTAIRPVLAGLFSCMVIIAGMMILTAGRSSTQVAGGLLTIRNAVFGGVIVLLGGGALLALLANAGVNLR